MGARSYIIKLENGKWKALYSHMLTSIRKEEVGYI